MNWLCHLGEVDWAQLCLQTLPVTIRTVALVCMFSAASLPTDAATQTADEALGRGARLQEAGDLEGAVAAYREAVRLGPNRLDAVSSLSLAYLRQGRPLEAIPGLRKARAAAPQHPGIAYYLGLAYFQSARFADARRELEWVLERQPTNHQALHLQGLCLLKLNQLVQGILALEVVLQADPANRQAAYTLGSAYIRNGQIPQAEALVGRHLLNDDRPEALLIKGSLRLAKKDYAEALATLERASASGERLPTLHSQIGVALLYEGRRDRAEEEFRTELVTNPSDFNANAFLGWLVQQNGDSEMALKLLRTAYSLNEGDTGVQYLLAQVHSSLGSWAEAKALLEQVVEAHPAFAPAHVMLARAYAKLKRTDLFRKQQEIIAELNARQQERDLQGVDQLYDGRVLSMPQQ